MGLILAEPRDPQDPNINSCRTNCYTILEKKKAIKSAYGGRYGTCLPIHQFLVEMARPAQLRASAPRLLRTVDLIRAPHTQPVVDPGRPVAMERRTAAQRQKVHITSLVFNKHYRLSPSPNVTTTVQLSSARSHHGGRHWANLSAAECNPRSFPAP